MKSLPKELIPANDPAVQAAAEKMRRLQEKLGTVERDLEAAQARASKRTAVADAVSALLASDDLTLPPREQDPRQKVEQLTDDAEKYRAAIKTVQEVERQAINAAGRRIRELALAPFRELARPAYFAFLDALGKTAKLKAFLEALDAVGVGLAPPLEYPHFAAEQLAIQLREFHKVLTPAVFKASEAPSGLEYMDESKGFDR